MRIGFGWDSHEFKSGVPLKIGGVELPHDKGLQATLTATSYYTP